VTKTGPVDAIPGDTIAYGVAVANHGRGPALSARLTDTFPDGSMSSFQLGLIKVASSDARAVSFTVSCTTPDLTVLTNTAVATGTDIIGNPATGSDTHATTVHAPVLNLTKTATTAVNAGEVITYTLCYQNTGSGDATSAVITDTLPVDVYYSLALDQGTGPAPNTVVGNPDGTTTLSWNVGTITSGSGGQMRYTARPSLLFLGGDTVANNAKLSFTNANGCIYPVTASSPTTITTVPPTRDPQGLGFWRNHPELLTAEILARTQATDDRFDGADGSAPDGKLSVSEVNAVLVPGGNMDKVLEEQLIATYLNLATRRINAGTAIASRTADRLGLDNVKEAAEFAIDTLRLPVDGNRGRYSYATTTIDEINNNRSEVY